MTLQLYMSTRFREAYKRASLTLKNMAEGRVHDLVRQYRSNPATLLHYYDSVAGLKTRVKEADLGGGERLLFDSGDGYIILLHMGGHEIVNRYTNQMAARDFEACHIAPPFFWPERAGFFKRNPDMALPLYWEEEGAIEQWIYYLSAAQKKVNKKIWNRLWKLYDRGEEVPPFFVLGGPGTGKTCVVLDLLRWFCDIDPAFSARMIISDELADFVQQVTGADLGPYRTDFFQNWSGIDLLLVDDPSTKWRIEQVLQAKRRGDIRAAVIAFDPLQLEKGLSDCEYRQLVDTYGVHPYPLNVCYRQKANVGAVTKHVVDMIADSSPYAAKEKIAHHRAEHEELTALANQLTFENPAGYVEYYPNTIVPDIQREVERILQHPWLMWNEYAGLLVVEGLTEGYVLSEGANEALRPLEERGYVRRVSLHSVERIKGLEFQHVFIFIDKELFAEVQQGFTGSGRKTYDRRRLFRIPFSRAKDSIVTFAL